MNNDINGLFSLHNKTAVVIGGGSGIGKAIAVTFARQGATVHVVDIDAVAAAQVADSLVAANLAAYAHQSDISDKNSVEQVFAKAGSFDILVNSAGIAHIGKAASTMPVDFERVYNVNVKGVYHALHAGIPILQHRGGGVILNIASIAGIVGIPDRFAYSMSKGAVLSMTMSVARDYLADHIRCNSISPARVHTPFVDGFLAKNYPGREDEMFEALSKSQPIGRMGSTEEVARLALYLCSDEAGFITGNDYPIDGGFIKLNN